MAQAVDRQPNDAILRSDTLDRLFSVTRVSVEAVAYVSLAMVAAILRFWDIGSRAMHHDESLHVLYSWYLFVGRGYQHDPMMHGPFQFHANTLFFFLFGDTDATGRFLYATFGTALIVLPVFLRPWIGRWGALATSALLVISPTMLYFSRFARNDILMAVWNLGLAIVLWRYLLKRQARDIYVAAALLSLGFATKETQYITVAVFGSFFTGWLLWDLAPRLGKGSLPSLSNLRAMPLLGVLIVLGSLTLPQLSAFARLTPLVSADPSQLVIGPWTTTRMIASEALVVATLFVVGAGVGLWWNRQVWAGCAALFYSIYVLLYTTFFTNLPGFGSGVWGSLNYWLDQQSVMRGGQPWYYYLLIIPVYEFLPVLLSAGALLTILVRRKSVSPFSAFLWYWLVAGTFAYSKAGEKMPWLAVHMVLPIIVIAGQFLGQRIESADWKAAKSWRVLGACALFLLSAMVFAAVLAAVIATGGAPVAVGRTLVLSAMAGLLTIGALQLGLPLGWKGLLGLAGSALCAVLIVLTLRASTTAAYKNGDTASEMLVYTQSTPDITRLMLEINRISLRATGGTDLKISVDSTSGFTWPWAWYLRHYKNVDYPSLTNAAAPPSGQIALVHSSNYDRMKPYLTDYAPGVRYRHRWWFPEDYKTAIEWIAAMGSPAAATPGKPSDAFTFGDVLAATFSPTGLDTLWRYFFNRDLGKPLGSEDAYFFVKADLASSAIAPAAGAVSPARPAAQDEYLSKIVAARPSALFGSKGTGPGQVSEPKGIAVDGSGNLFVVDTGNNRIEKFDSNGRFLAQVGRKGSGDGEFQEPWSVTIGPDGLVWVTDTWNHRIQKFDSELRFLGKFGEFGEAGSQVSASPGRFYGPRAIAFLPDGTLLVTDTGNKRIQRFRQEGQFVAAYGGGGPAPGQFAEPVGIASGADGSIWVADTWNRRIQHFDADMRPLAVFPVRGWESTGILNKPYLAVDLAGNILTTDPENHRVLKFSPDGQILAVLGRLGAEPGMMNIPIGIAADAAGGFYVSESAGGRVQRFDTLP